MQFVNLTPHVITIVSGNIEQGARPGSFVAQKSDLEVILELPKGDKIATIEFDEESAKGTIPMRKKTLGEISDLPPQQEGIVLIVSQVVALAAAAAGRDTSDLAVPGQQVRDKADPRIVLGCLSLDIITA